MSEKNQTDHKYIPTAAECMAASELYLPSGPYSIVAKEARLQSLLTLDNSLNNPGINFIKHHAEVRRKYPSEMRILITTYTTLLRTILIASVLGLLGISILSIPIIIFSFYGLFSDNKTTRSKLNELSARALRGKRIEEEQPTSK